MSLYNELKQRNVFRVAIAYLALAWLPLNRGDYDIDVILRLYVPDMDKFKMWSPPVAEKL